MLLDELQPDHHHRQIIAAPQLVVRESTARVAGAGSAAVVRD
jgi:hypothetical protein